VILVDFGIICIGQEQASIPPKMNDLVFESYKRTADSAPFYNEDYHFHTADQLSGYWYNIWLPESIRYDESFFDIAPKGVPYVEVIPKWTEYVRNLLSFYIDQSPIKKIAVLLRVQDFSDDTVHSACSLNEFIQGLTAGSIRWNELYFVH